MGMLKILKGKGKSSSKPYVTNDSSNSYDITKKQYKEIKKRACPWKFLVVENNTGSYYNREVLVYSYIQNNGIQQLRFQNKKGQKVSSQTQLPFYFSKPYCISNEFYYYEIKIVKNTDSKIYFGLGLSNYMLTDLPGTVYGSVCYHSSGLIYAGGSVVAYAQAVSEGDVVGIGYYPSNGNIFFTLNGKYIQTLSGEILHKNRFFPHLGSDGECILEVNFGMNHFLYKPEESNKFLTTEQLNNINIKKENERNERIEKNEEDLNTVLFKDSYSSLPKINVKRNESKGNDPSSTETTNNESYIENANKKTDNSNIDFFESIDTNDYNFTSNNQNSSSTLFTSLSDSSTSKYNSLPSSSSTIFNNNNFGSNNQSTLFPISEDVTVSNALVPISDINNMAISQNPSNPFSPMYMNNNNSNSNLNNNNNNMMNTSFTSMNTSFSGSMNNLNTNYGSTTSTSYNPNNPFNDLMGNTNTNNNNNNNNNLLLSGNTSFDSSFSNTNQNNFGTLNHSSTYSGSASFSNNNTFGNNNILSSNPFSSNNNGSTNNYGSNRFSTTTTSSSTMFNTTSSFNNLLLPSSSSATTSWMPTSSIATSVQNSMNTVSTTSISNPMLTLTRTFSLRDDEKKTSFSNLGMTNSKHLSVNNMTSSSSSMYLSSNLTSSGNDLSNKPFMSINTNPTSPVLSNLSSNLSSPINSPFGSSFNSPTTTGSPNIFSNNLNSNTNTSLNDYNNANILANTSMDSSFSLNNNFNTGGITHANTYSNSIGNNNTGNSFFNMSKLASANNAISDELNGKTQSSVFTPSTPSNALVKSSLSSNPFNTPLNSSSPSSLSNPFGTPSNGIKQLTFESSPIQSSGNLSFHAPIVSNSGNTATSATTWNNTFGNTTDTFSSSTPMMTPTAPPVVTTNLTGVQSIYSTSNPFEGIH